MTQRPQAAGRIDIIRSVPTSVPKGGPTTIIWEPTPIKFEIKNGPEIVDFRPVP